MARRSLPAIVGFVLGALAVALLLRHYGTEYRLTTAAAPVPLAKAPAAAPAAGADPAVTSAASAGVDAVDSLLPPEDSVNARIHAIVNLGASDPAGAIAAALALPEHAQRRLALLRLAPLLAASDPLGAIAAIEERDPPYLRTEFMTALFDAWAALDPAAVFEWLESGELSRVPPGADALTALAAHDAERLLEISGNLRRDVARSAAAAAFRSMMQVDAAGTLARLDKLPPGAISSSLASAAAEALAQQDPEAAAAWATATQADADTWYNIIVGAREVDPELGWDILLSQWENPDSPLHGSVRRFLSIYAYFAVSSKTSEEVFKRLDQLVSLDDPELASATGVELRNWANENPEVALEWTLANLDRINADYVLRGLSSGLARDNLALARQTLLRLDDEHAGSWSAGVTEELAQQDLHAARAWTFEFPSGPARDAGLIEVISAESKGGTVDRQLFELFSDDSARDEAASLAARRLDCAGQTELALDLATSFISDERERDMVIRFNRREPPYDAQQVSIQCQMMG